MLITSSGSLVEPAIEVLTLLLEIIGFLLVLFIVSTIIVVVSNIIVVSAVLSTVVRFDVLVWAVKVQLILIGSLHLVD